MQHRDKSEDVNKATQAYTEELISKHVSGRLKVAPEHTSDRVLQLMRKPSFKRFEEFNRTFTRINKAYGLNQQLIPYFISSHPGCQEEDMAELATITKGLHFQLEQVQDFTPTPMTLATEMYYTGYHPLTGERVFTARTKEEKLAQRQYFFWYHPDRRKEVQASLKRLRREDLLQKLYGNPQHPSKGKGNNKPQGGKKRTEEEEPLPTSFAGKKRFTKKKR